MVYLNTIRQVERERYFQLAEKSNTGDNRFRACAKMVLFGTHALKHEGFFQIVDGLHMVISHS